MQDIKELLNKKTIQYNTPSFVGSDPISIPHRFSRKEDVEISGFLTSIIAWGRRTAIIDKAGYWMELMYNEPFRFMMESSENEMKRFEKYVYRTFNPDDCLFIITSLKNLYRHHGGLEGAFSVAYKQTGCIMESIISVRSLLLSTPHLKRSEKHIANPGSGSAAKRINMFLRWMI